MARSSFTLFMRTLIASTFILTIAIACVPKTTPPELKPLVTANEVLLRVQELQNTVIGLHDATPSQISKPRADLIVKFTVSAAEIISKSVDGWKVTVKSAWLQLKENIKTPEAGLLTVWTLVDAMILAL